MEARAEDVETREKATAALAAALGSRGAEVEKGEEEVKASAVLLTRETDRVSAELEETRSKERALKRKEEDLARREGELARARKDVEQLQEAALHGKGQLLEIQLAQVRVQEEALKASKAALDGKREALVREREDLAAGRGAPGEQAAGPLAGLPAVDARPGGAAGRGGSPTRLGARPPVRQ